MDNPRAEKVAVVDDVRARFEGAQAALLTEYRGIDVASMATLRRALRAAGGDYKIYKNTLVRLAANELGYDLDELLTGPTAIAFVPDQEGSDPVTVAKALKAFGKDNPDLVVKGGLLGDRLLTADEAKALADVAPREELLARLAGGIAAPMVQFAGLLQALPRNFAYGLAALIEQGGAPGAPVDAPAAAEPEASEATEPEATEPEAAAEATDESTPTAESNDEAPAADAADTTTNDDSAPAESAPTEES